MSNPELERKIRNSFERLRLMIGIKFHTERRSREVEELINEEEATVLGAVKTCGCVGEVAPRPGGTVDLAQKR